MGGVHYNYLPHLVGAQRKKAKTNLKQQQRKAPSLVTEWGKPACTRVSSTLPEGIYISPSNLATIERRDVLT